MSKYQRLSSVENDANTADNVNDGDFSLYFNRNAQTNHYKANNNHSSHNLGMLHYDSGSASPSPSPSPNVTSSTSTLNTNIETDESTIEVPLLNNNNNLHSDYELPSPHHSSPITANTCPCEQPGFGANLKNKSTQEAKLRILLAILLCCVFMIIEFLGGYLAGSLAIMTDAAHLASDCISFVIGLVAIWLGSKPPDNRMSFGYKRMEVMGALVSIVGIWTLTGTLIIVAIERIYANDYDLDANTMMIISGIGILINIVMVFILHGSSVLPGSYHGHSHAHAHAIAHGHAHATDMAPHHAMQSDVLPLSVDSNDVSPMTITNGLKHAQSCDAHHEKNLNLRAAMIHVIGDLVQSIGVFLASVLIKIYPSAKFVDALCTLLFSFIVIMTTVRLFRESLEILLDAVPKNVSLDKLKVDLSRIEGVRSVHHLNVWNHSANHCVLMAHLVIDTSSDGDIVLKKATHLACSSKYNIKHCTIQIERVTL